MRPVTAEPVTDFPAPDSPTTPNTSPRAMSKEMPSMALSEPRRVTNSTRRSRTERTGSVIAILALSSQFRIERIAQPIAQKIDGENERRECDARKSDNPPFAREQV